MSTKFRNYYTWSKSRDLAFQECPRRYFYHDYGSWGGWDRHAAARTRLLYVLKQLQTRHMWAGGKGHDAVQRLLQSVQAGLPVPGADALADRTLRRMRAEFKEPRDLLHHDDPKDRCGLYEHEYDVTVDDREYRTCNDRKVCPRFA